MQGTSGGLDEKLNKATSITNSSLTAVGTGLCHWDVGSFEEPCLETKTVASFERLANYTLVSQHSNENPRV